MRRRRPGWRPAVISTLVAIAAASLTVPAASSAPAPRGPDVHSAGVGLDGPAGAPRETPIPWLARAGSDRRPARSVAGGAAAAGREPLAPVPLAPAFDGVPDVLGTSPADPTGALGTLNHVGAVNVHMGAYSRAGDELYPPKRLRSLDDKLPSGVEDFDPKVVYDPYDQVFIVAFLASTSQRSFISLVVIPEGAEDDDTGSGWCTLHMSGDQIAWNGKQFADYPMVGLTADRVTLTTNQFDFSNAPDIGAFRYSQVVSIRKADLYDCAVDPVPIRVFGGKKTRDPDGSRAFTIVPAISMGGDPRTQFMASIDLTGSTGKLILWRLKRVNRELRLSRAHIASKRMTYPPFGLQCGGGVNRPDTWWDTGDLRLTSAFWDGALGRLYTATSLKGNRGGGPIESIVKWWEVDPASRLSNSGVRRTGTIGAAGRDAAWPSVVTDGDGNLWVNYASAGVDECLSAYAAVVVPGALGASSIRYRQGEARYEFSAGRPERWGDFTAATRDPVDPTVVAVYGAYPLFDGGGPTRNWQQTIATLRDA